jgi:hypothetical protein
MVVAYQPYMAASRELAGFVIISTNDFVFTEGFGMTMFNAASRGCGFWACGFSNASITSSTRPLLA